MNKSDMAKVAKLEAKIESLQHQIDVLTMLVKNSQANWHYSYPINPANPHLPVMPEPPYKVTC